MKTIEYTTSMGVTVKIKPISPDYVQLIEKQVPLPEAPHYENTLLGGAVEKIYHTETSITTEEEKAAWAEYKLALAAAQEDIFIRKTRAVIRRCIVVDMPDDDGWIRSQAEDGITVPEDPEERRIHYVKTEVFGNANDVLFVVQAAMKLARFDEEDYKASMSFFRDKVEGAAA